MCLDEKLNFENYTEGVRKKALKAIKALWAILNKRSTLSTKNKNLIYKSIIRPILTYASCKDTSEKTSNNSE